MSASRAPIERWSRSELEDHFHSISGQVQELKQNNHQLRRDLKIRKSRVGAGRESNGRNGPEMEEMDELQRSNRVLSQKLKVLKHQLLSYTAINRPRPTATGTRPSTAQSRQATIGGGEAQQKAQNQQQPRQAGPLGRRPQSAVVGAGRRKLGDQAEQRNTLGMGRAIPASAGGILEKESGKDKPKEEELREEARKAGGRQGESRGWMEIVPEEKPFQQRQSGLDGQIGEEAAANGRVHRELQRQSRGVLAENEELRFSLDKSEQKLATLRREYDRIALELEQTRKELRSQSDSLSSFRDEAQRTTENSSKSVEISDRELAILREECRSLKAAYDRLVTRSLNEENSGKTTLEELARLRAQLEENSSEGERERREWEGLVQRLRADSARKWRKKR